MTSQMPPRSVLKWVGGSASLFVCVCWLKVLLNPGSGRCAGGLTSHKKVPAAGCKHNTRRAHTHTHTYLKTPYKPQKNWCFCSKVQRSADPQVLQQGQTPVVCSWLCKSVCVSVEVYVCVYVCALQEAPVSSQSLSTVWSSHTQTRVRMHARTHIYLMSSNLFLLF